MDTALKVTYIRKMLSIKQTDWSLDEIFCLIEPHNDNQLNEIDVILLEYLADNYITDYQQLNQYLINLHNPNKSNYYNGLIDSYRILDLTTDTPIKIMPDSRLMNTTTDILVDELIHLVKTHLS